MKFKSILSIVLIVLGFCFTSCEKYKSGVCEFYRDWSDAYYCYPDDSEYDCDSRGSESHYHSGVSCNYLGYTRRPLSEIYFVSPYGSGSPGDYGSFSSDDGGGGGSSTPSYCTDYYEGPGVGTQLDSYCEGAYIYLCDGGYDANSEEVTSYCDLYDAMNDNNYPACGYCQ